MSRIIVDAGPLLEGLVASSPFHGWVNEQWPRLAPPLLTCEAVLSEAVFLLRREESNADALFAMLDRGMLKIDISVETHLQDIRALMNRYRNLPMSLADACLVRLAEIYPDATIFTLDSDFRIYRKHGNKVIPLLTPDR